MDKATVHRLFNAGKTYQQIAKATGSSEHYVGVRIAQWRKREGIAVWPLRADVKRARKRVRRALPQATAIKIPASKLAVETERSIVAKLGRYTVRLFRANGRKYTVFHIDDWAGDVSRESGLDLDRAIEQFCEFCRTAQARAV